MGKCVCAVIKDKASELFHPLQFGVACTAGSEKIIHGLRKCIEDHWDDEDFVVLKVDMRNAFNLVRGKPSWMNVLLSSLNSNLGYYGAMVHIQHYGIRWAACLQNQGFSRGTH